MQGGARCVPSQAVAARLGVSWEPPPCWPGLGLPRPSDGPRAKSPQCHGAQHPSPHASPQSPLPGLWGQPPLLPWGSALGLLHWGCPQPLLQPALHTQPCLLIALKIFKD